MKSLSPEGRGSRACPESELHPRLKQEKGKRECPRCRLGNVKAEREMVGQTCPRCKEGAIEEIWTGRIS